MISTEDILRAISMAETIYTSRAKYDVEKIRGDLYSALYRRTQIDEMEEEIRKHYDFLSSSGVDARVLNKAVDSGKIGWCSSCKNKKSATKCKLCTYNKKYKDFYEEVK
jgi:hypothetical protein